MDFNELEKPDESDCCNSGCSPCILDLYQERKRSLQLKSKHSLLQQYNNCVSELSYSIFKLISIIPDSLSCNLYTFEYCRRSKILPNNTDLNNFRLILKPGQHLLLKNAQKQFTRAYTPIPQDTNNKLQFTVLVKLYENGLMSNYIKSLPIDAETLWRGPYGTCQTIKNTLSDIILIAQGTGIAPLYAIVKEMLENDQCDVVFKLLYSCRCMNEIPLRGEIYYLSRFWNFTYELFLSDSENVSPKYNEIIHKNKLSADYMREFMNKLQHKQNSGVLICGSEVFMRYYRDNVIRLGFNKEHVVLF